MQVNRQWSDEMELFEDVAQALENGLEGAQCIARQEVDSYGDNGTIHLHVMTPQGVRAFKLVLAEVL